MTDFRAEDLRESAREDVMACGHHKPTACQGCIEEALDEAYRAGLTKALELVLEERDIGTEIERMREKQSARLREHAKKAST